MAKKAKHGALKVYKSYLFIDKDPIIDSMRTVHQLSGKTFKAASEDSGVSAGTLARWFSGNVRRPQFATVAAFAVSNGKRTITFVGGKPVLK